MLLGCGRESYQFMYARPWQKVNEFYLDVVNGSRSLSQLFGKEVGFCKSYKVWIFTKLSLFMFLFQDSFLWYWLTKIDIVDHQKLSASSIWWATTLKDISKQLWQILVGWGIYVIPNVITQLCFLPKYLIW